MREQKSCGHHHEEQGGHCGCGHHHEEQVEHCGCGHHHEEQGEHGICAHHHEPREHTEHSKVFLLENLGCANCAAKMEAEIRALPGVRAATVTYTTKQLASAPTVRRSFCPGFKKSALPLNLRWW